MDSLKICLFAVVGVTLCLIIRQWKSDFLPLVRLALTVLFSVLILSAAAPIVSYLKNLTETAGISGYAAFLIKALGIAILTQCCSDICRECGESGAANGVELAGKIEILLLSLPLINEILSTAKELLSLTA